MFKDDDARAYFVKLEKEIDHPTGKEWVDAAIKVCKRSKKMKSFASYLIKNVLKEKEKNFPARALRG